MGETIGRLPMPVGIVGLAGNGPVRTDPGPGPETAPPGRATRPAEAPGRASPSGRRVGPAGGPSPFDELIREAALREGVDEHLVRAVVEAESGFRPGAVSPAGAMGLMQLMPGTARTLGVRDPYDPASNVAGGVRFLNTMLERFRSVPLALAAYNAGPGAVEKFGGVPPYRETRSYVDRVLQLQQRNQVEAVARSNQGGGNGGERTV